MNNWY